MNEKKESDNPNCPVFLVRSGGPIIGLGILMILFGVIPYLAARIPVPITVVPIFIGFGAFLIWAGITK